MILETTYKKEWLEEKAKVLGKVDSKLLEKVIMALALLEQLKLNGFDFVFKGGTSLILILENPHRFSIDIDIVVAPKHKDLKSLFDKVVSDSVFTKWTDDNERKGNTKAPVEHYKFFYRSAVNDFFGEEPILLDILYDSHSYSKLNTTSIKHAWLKTKAPIESVSTPSTEDILGDKLTAFAPNTTGILYSKNKPVEMIKQLYDIGSLFNVVTDLSLVSKTFKAIAKTEISYRELKITHNEILQDIFDTAKLISERDARNKHFLLLQKGIGNIQNFIFIEKFYIESAIICASKAAYISRLLALDLKEIPHRYTTPVEIKDWIIENTEYNKFNKLKKGLPEAFFYWYKTIELIK